MKNCFNLSYDLIDAKKPEDSNKLRLYISCLLIKDGCDPIKRYTESDIIFSSNESLEYFKDIFDMLDNCAYIVISQIQTDFKGTPEFKLINRNETLEKNFDVEIDNLLELSPSNLDAELGGCVTYFMYD